MMLQPVSTFSWTPSTFDTGHRGHLRLVSTCSPAPSCTSNSTHMHNVHLDALRVSPWRCWRLDSSAGCTWISFWDLQRSAAAREQMSGSHRLQVSQQIWAIAAPRDSRTSLPCMDAVLVFGLPQLPLLHYQFTDFGLSYKCLRMIGWQKKISVEVK